MNDFFSFRTMITPVIIQIVFWLGVVACILTGLSFIWAGIQLDARYGVAGFLILIFGPLVVRIYCELLMILFRINETLTEIKHTLEERRATPPTQATPQV